jgi:L-amino acid N-acyltransferase YncA
MIQNLNSACPAQNRLECPGTKNALDRPREQIQSRKFSSEFRIDHTSHGSGSDIAGVEDMQIRDAVLSDLEQITEIYNQVVLTSTAIYNDRPSTLDERITWWRGRRAQGYPVLVAMDAEGTDGGPGGSDGVVSGFASLGEFRAWPGYRFTVEGTVHIHSSVRGQGVGTALLEELVRLAREVGKHTMIAGVDAENVASLRFLERFGFERVAHFREVGYKFDRFLDLIFLQYWLDSPRRNQCADSPIAQGSNG